MKKIIIGVIAVAMLAVPTAAIASVTIDAYGKGFVGKGDVQTAFGWNDAALQAKAGDVSFTYESKSDDTYAVTCEWDTGNKQIVHHVQNKSASLIDSVAYDVTKVDRKNPNQKITGFNLTGKTGEIVTESGIVPVVDASCPATGNEGGTDNSVNKLITAVELVSHESSEKLTATYAGLSAVIWQNPAIQLVA
jgi:hypothetical protein